MQRRQFLASSLAASAVSPLGRAAGAADPSDSGKPKEFYELRLIHLRRGPKVKLFEDFLREAALPALNRAGIGPVGVFNVTIGPASPTFYLLLPFSSLESWAAVPQKLLGDAEYQKRGAEVLNAPSTDPAYIRIESSLMEAFEGFSKLALPPGLAGNRRRIFELRTYESHSAKAHRKKVEMFDRSEIAIFRRVGMRPVFFGSTLIGPSLPSLTYMLAFDNTEDRDKTWAAFSADPEWQKLRATPGYTDGEIVSSATNAFLTPTPFSQI